MVTLLERSVSTGIPLGAIIGIAVGGAVLLLTVSITIAVCLARHKDQIERKKLDNIHSPARSKRASRYHSFNPFATQQAANVTAIDRSPVLDQGRLDRVSSPSRNVFRMSMGGSRQLGSSKSQASLTEGFEMVVNDGSMRRSVIAPPGYALPREPKRLRVSVPTAPGPFENTTNSAILADGSPRYSRVGTGRRSTSESHLTSILRSTSQRLNTSESDLSRSLTMIKRPSPGKVRFSRLATESCEGLIVQRPTITARSPHPGKMVPRSAGYIPPKRAHSPTRADSPGSDEERPFESRAPDMVTPATISSPSRHSRRPSVHSHKVRVSSVSSVNISATVCRDVGASVDDSVEYSTYIIPHHVSLTADPHFSSVKSSRPGTVSSLQWDNKPSGPRDLRKPLRLQLERKDTFAKDPFPSASNVPPGAISPLVDISGNKQSPRSIHEASTRNSFQTKINPFKFSPKQYSPIDGTSTGSPTRSMKGKQRGHKRSQVVRISGISRPTSVCVVPEESEDEGSPCPSQYQDRRTPIQDRDLLKQSSPTRDAPRPPSISVFELNHVLPTPPLFFDRKDIATASQRQKAGHSPTLSLSDLYNDSEEDIRTIESAQSPPTSSALPTSRSRTDIYPLNHHRPQLYSLAPSYLEIQLPKANTNNNTSPKLYKPPHPQDAPHTPSKLPSARRQPLNVSKELFLSARNQLFAFPPPLFHQPPYSSDSPKTSPPTSPPTSPSTPPRRTCPPPFTSPASPPRTPHSRTKSLHAFQKPGMVGIAYPAPPLLTTGSGMDVAVPGHLTGPREDFRRGRPGSRIGVSEEGQDEAPSVKKSINMLRRMNSEVCGSRGGYRTLASLTGEVGGVGVDGMERSAAKRRMGHVRNESVSGGGSSSGTQGKRRYRNVGAVSSCAIGQWEDADEGEEERDEKAEIKGLGIQGFRFPTLSRVGSMGGTPPEIKLVGRNGMTDAAKRENRRGGHFHYYSRVVGTNIREDGVAVGEDSPTLKGVNAPAIRVIDGEVNAAGVPEHMDQERDENRPDSLGLYDQDGFLISASPGRERGSLSPKRWTGRVLERVDEGRRLSGHVFM